MSLNAVNAHRTTLRERARAEHDRPRPAIAPAEGAPHLLEVFPDRPAHGQQYGRPGTGTAV